MENQAGFPCLIIELLFNAGHEGRRTLTQYPSICLLNHAMKVLKHMLIPLWFCYVLDEKLF